MQNFHKALGEYNKVSADRRAAIKDAKRNKGALWSAANQATLGRVSNVSDHAAKSKRYHDRRKEKVAKRLARQK